MLIIIRGICLFPLKGKVLLTCVSLLIKSPTTVSTPHTIFSFSLFSPQWVSHLRRRQGPDLDDLQTSAGVTTPRLRLGHRGDLGVYEEPGGQHMSVTMATATSVFILPKRDRAWTSRRGPQSLVSVTVFPSVSSHPQTVSWSSVTPNLRLPLNNY